jgi:hypothetical protein
MSGILAGRHILFCMEDVILDQLCNSFSSNMQFILSNAFPWHCLIYIVLVITVISPIGFLNPRIMMHSYPKAIQNMIPPKTPWERKQTVMFAIPMLTIMIGYPAVVSWYYNSSNPTFANFFLSMWTLMMAFNIFDLLVLDWLVFCYITPKFIVLKGTEGSPAYKDYLFHFIGSLKGVVITGTISAVASCIIWLFS